MKFSLIWTVNPLAQIDLFLLPMSSIDNEERDDAIQISAQLFRSFLENVLADRQHEEGIRDRVVWTCLCSINESPLKSLPLRLNNSNIQLEHESSINKR